MKRSILLVFLVFLAFVSQAQAQNKRLKPSKRLNPISRNTTKPKVGVVVNERLAILRIQPSLYADSIQRMRTGRILTISNIKVADGVTFYRVLVPPKNYGWVQADAVISKNKKEDDQKLFQLIQASDGFEQIERGVIYLENFPDSQLRPAILLFLGDLIEELAAKLSREANRQLDKREMSVSGAPLHSYYLNHSSLDRYRKIGINFWFNSSTKLFHYNGVFWNEIIAKFPKSNEAVEAKKRLDSLKEKMEPRL